MFFVDESGDFGFVGDASKYYVVTFVFHNKKDDISENIEKINSCPVFHMGPLIRREYPFQDLSFQERKRLIQKMFIFMLGLPIKVKIFIFEKKQFEDNKIRMQKQISRSFYDFFMDQESSFYNCKLKIYYDNGQRLITKLIKDNLSLTMIEYEFINNVRAKDYRLYQVADFITTIKLIEIKMKNNDLSNTERKMFNERYLNKNYLKAIKKKEENNL